MERKTPLRLILVENFNCEFVKYLHAYQCERNSFWFSSHKSGCLCCGENKLHYQGFFWEEKAIFLPPIRSNKYTCCTMRLSCYSANIDTNVYETQSIASQLQLLVTKEQELFSFTIVIAIFSSEKVSLLIWMKYFSISLLKNIGA